MDRRCRHFRSNLSASIRKQCRRGDAWRRLFVRIPNHSQPVLLNLTGPCLPACGCRIRCQAPTRNRVYLCLDCLEVPRQPPPGRFYPGFLQGPEPVEKRVHLLCFRLGKQGLLIGTEPASSDPAAIHNVARPLQINTQPIRRTANRHCNSSSVMADGRFQARRRIQRSTTTVQKPLLRRTTSRIGQQIAQQDTRPQEQRLAAGSKAGPSVRFRR